MVQTHRILKGFLETVLHRLDKRRSKETTKIKIEFHRRERKEYTEALGDNASSILIVYKFN